MVTRNRRALRRLTLSLCCATPSAELGLHRSVSSMSFATMAIRRVRSISTANPFAVHALPSDRKRKPSPSDTSTLGPKIRALRSDSILSHATETTTEIQAQIERELGGEVHIAMG